jgi:hypothetical protein
VPDTRRVVRSKASVANFRHGHNHPGFWTASDHSHSLLLRELAEPTSVPGPVPFNLAVPRSVCPRTNAASLTFASFTVNAAIRSALPRHG